MAKNSKRTMMISSKSMPVQHHIESQVRITRSFLYARRVITALLSVAIQLGARVLITLSAGNLPRATELLSKVAGCSPTLEVRPSYVGASSLCISALKLCRRLQSCVAACETSKEFRAVEAEAALMQFGAATFPTSIYFCPAAPEPEPEQ